jgi:antitoxin (DNA-binding transcriptional repressor) of toxin-antitoxin stability system
MSTITLEEAQSQLAELIHRLKPGDEVLITENQLPIARLTVTPKQQTSHKPRQARTLRGTVTYMAPDFNAPLDDFREYME